MKASTPASATEIRDLRAELKEEHEWRMRLHDEVAALKANLDARTLEKVRLLDALQVERDMLLARVQQIELRCEALGGNIGLSTRHELKR